jgi:hypothetical protein
MFPVCETNVPRPQPGLPTTWGTATTSSFRVRVCVDQEDTLRFQDDRLWFAYAGQYSAAGAHGACPDRYKGRAYINNAQWDISEYGAACSGNAAGAGGQHGNGGNCPVSPTFTDEQFMVPMGCSAVTTTVQKTRGRGEVTVEEPTAGNGWRGGITIVDAPGSSAVYDIRVTLSCAGAESSTPHTPVRLSCSHNYGTGSCHMGRIEVFQPNALHIGGTGHGTWGTVCGHYTCGMFETMNLSHLTTRRSLLISIS